MAGTSSLHAAVLRHARDLISVVDADGVVRYVNQPASELLGGLGIEVDATVPSALTYVHPEDVPRALAHRQWLLAEAGRSGTTVLRMQVGDGWRHLETTGINLHDDPDVGGLLYISHDVEDRVREREELARALAAQRVVSEIGLLALKTRDIEGFLRRALDRLAALLLVPQVTLSDLPSGIIRRSHLTTGAAGVPAAHGLPLVIELHGPDGVLGQLCAAARARPYSESETETLRAVANVLTSALLRSQSERAAVADALHDPLTGLATRSLLLERMHRALERPGQPCALLLIDLDRFKAVNDTFGHAAGDEVLAALGPRLEQCVRPTDTVGRYGGDEFVILCEETCEPDVVGEIADRVRRACGKAFVLSSGQQITLAGSVGVAWSSPTATDPIALLAAADAHMYRDKRR